MKGHSFSSGQQRLILLNTIFTTVLVVSNFLSAKVANLWGFLIPAGTIGYDSATRVMAGSICGYLAILDTPFFYLFTRRPVAKENEEA